jgi:hypothetical protein
MHALQLWMRETGRTIESLAEETGLNIWSIKRYLRGNAPTRKIQESFYILSSGKVDFDSWHDLNRLNREIEDRKKDRSLNGSIEFANATVRRG